MTRPSHALKRIVTAVVATSILVAACAGTGPTPQTPATASGTPGARST